MGFFEECVLNAGELRFANKGWGNGWGDEEVTQLASMLPAFELCWHLELHGHTFGEVGLDALRDVLPKLHMLTLIELPQHLQQTLAGKAFTKTWLELNRFAYRLRWCPHKAMS